MKLRDHDWRLHKDVKENLEVLAILYTVFPACGAIASAVTGDKASHGAFACLIIVGMINLAMLFIAMLRGSDCIRQPWLSVIGTAVKCQQEVQSWWHLNRDADPVWQWLWAQGIYDRDVHQEDDKRTFVFRRRSHAMMFKLAWGVR